MESGCYQYVAIVLARYTYIPDLSDITFCKYTI